MVVILLTLLAMNTRPGYTQPESIKKNKILIVATIEPLGAIAREIGGDHVTVKVIVPAGSDPHKFVPELKHRELVSRCDLFISVGKEPFLKMLGEINALEISWNEWIKGGVYLDEMKNPHYIWLYPPNAKIVARVIYEALSKIDPFNERYYYERLVRFGNMIDELTSWTSKMVKVFKIERAKIVLAAPHFKPLIEFLKFEIIDIIIAGAEKKAGPKDVEEAIESIKKYGADVIVVLITASESDEGRIAKVVSEATGVPIVYSAGVPLYPNEDYISFIKSDIISLLTAIKISRERYLSRLPAEIGSSDLCFELQVYTLLSILYLVTLANLYLVSKER